MPAEHDPPDGPAALLQAALDGTAATAQAAVDLRDQIEQVQKDRRRDKRVYVAMLATILLVLLAMFGGGWWYVSDTRHRSADATADRAALAATLSRTQHLASRIDDCISSDGKCYRERTLSRYGDPSGPVNTVIILAAACAQQAQGDDAILACVRRKLASAAHASNP